MKTAFSYYRWSTKEQGTDGKDSLLRQRTSATQWMNHHGTRLGYVLSSDTFIDAGKSGYKGKHIATDEYGKARGELARFIQCVEQGKIARDSILLVDDFSRFSRMAPMKSIELFSSVINSGIGLVFTGSYEKRVIDERLITNEPHILGFIIGEMIRSFSESHEKGRKVSAAIQNKNQAIAKSDKVYCHNLPFYFTFVPTESSNIGKYVVNDGAKLVKRIIDLYLGGKSLYNITQLINGDGIKTPRGKNWEPTSVKYILKDRHIIGEHLGKKGYCPEIVDETTFNRIQVLLSQNKKNIGRKGAVNIFKGICFCGICGNSLTMNSFFTGGIHYRYLRCQNHSHNSCTNKNLFPLSGAFGMEQDFFLNFLFKTPTQLLNGSDAQEVKELQKDITTKQTRLNAVTAEIQKLVALSETLPLDELKAKLAKLNGERDVLKMQIDELNINVSKVQGATHDMGDLHKLLFGANEKGKGKSHEEILNETELTELQKRYFKGVEVTIDSLQDTYTREGIRIMLPSIIGKITVDGERYTVFNRAGKPMYQNKLR